MTAVIDPREVQSWRDLGAFLSQSVSDEYFDWGESSVRQTSTFVKSYIVEIDRIEADPYTHWNKAFRNTTKTNEDGLVFVEADENTPLFVDVRDPRFTVVHTIAKTDDSDRAVLNLAEKSNSGFDRAWFPSKLLFNSHEIGVLRGFKFSHQPIASGVRNLPAEQGPMSPPIQISEQLREFDAEIVQQTDPTDNGEDAPVPRKGLARIPQSSLAAKDNYTALSDYHAIRESGVFLARRSLDWIQYEAREENGGNLSHTIYSNGKITASGNSIGLHMFAIERLKTMYAREIRRIEDEFGIRWTSAGEGDRFAGEPIYILLPGELIVDDLYTFVKSIFRPARPFRLLGVPHSVSNERIDVEAVDLHTGDTLSVEVTRSWMRIYLPYGSCGNVIARLLTNLQHTTSSDLGLYSGSGEELLTGISR